MSALSSFHDPPNTLAIRGRVGIRSRGILSQVVRGSCVVCAVWLASANAWAEGESLAPQAEATINDVAAAEAPNVPLVLDRAVVRFTAPETGGVLSPRFIFERELAFEARVEALADGSFVPTAEMPYLDSHVRAALERHVAETILETLEVTPQPTPQDIQRRVNGAQASLSQRVGSAEALDAAANAEGLGAAEVYRILQRQARASLYLDRMVAPMLRPSDAELQAIHQSGRTPFTKQPFDEIKLPLRRWYVARRLTSALLDYYEGARSRLKLHVL